MKKKAALERKKAEREKTWNNTKKRAREKLFTYPREVSSLSLCCCCCCCCCFLFVFHSLNLINPPTFEKREASPRHLRERVNESGRVCFRARPSPSRERERERRLRKKSTHREYPILPDLVVFSVRFRQGQT